MNSSRTKDATIGQRVAMIREHRMMTQVGLAAAIGISRSVIFHIEHGHTQVDLELAERLARALHCTIDDLLAPIDAPLPRARRSKRVDVDRLPSWRDVQASVRQ
jgi:DNA-binding XRE family transcriptional regulator